MPADTECSSVSFVFKLGFLQSVGVAMLLRHFSLRRFPLLKAKMKMASTYQFAP